MGFQRILVATDFSSCAAKALEVARDCARASQAKIILCTALDVPPDHSLLGRAFKPVIDFGEATEKAKTELKRVADQAGLGDLLEECLVCLHQPGEEIPKAARERGCDLIVTGTHGRSGIEKFFLGSVAQRILQNSALPVLIVPKRG